MSTLSPADIIILNSVLPAPLFAALRQLNPPIEAVAEGCAALERALAALAPFVPSPVVDMHLALPRPQSITSISLTGTLVFADLSGFTALSAQFAKSKRRGNEEISALLNRLFAALLAEVYAYGGGLIKFGGDSLTAFFDSARLGDDHAAHACAAALAMQQRMNDFVAVPTSKGPFRLQLRIAVHSGRVFGTIVGDASHSELIATGRAMNRVSVVQKSAMPGEVIISNETLALLQGVRKHAKLSGLSVLQSLAVTPPRLQQSGPTWQVRPPSLSSFAELLGRIAALRPYVPHGLPNRFLGPDAQNGEFRPVTVLFANFYAFRKLLTMLELPALVERDPTFIGQVLNAYYLRTQQVIHHYGGTINKVDMATFGDRLMALFGAPTAHEDDQTRAVRAGLDLQTTLDNLNDEIAMMIREWIERHPKHQLLLGMASIPLRQRIAIASGTVFAGIVGTPQRHEYTVMGPTVNLAARLLEATNDGDVLLTSLTHRAARRAIEAQPLQPLHLRGFAQPIPVLRAIRSAPAPAADSPPAATRLVGRQAQLAQLRALATRALQPGEPAGHVVALIGDVGVGKSRLVDELLRALRRTTPAAQQICVTCQGYEQTTPYAAITSLLRDLLQIAAGDNPATQAAALRRQIDDLAPAWSRFAPLLGPLLDLPLPETQLTAALSAEQRRDRLHDLIAMVFLARARRQPLALALDDFQWADASSVALIERLAADLSSYPLLLVLLYQAPPDPAESWRAHPHSTTIALGELKLADSEALLQALLGSALPAELKPLIERAQGTPLFLEEIVRYLIESGVLERDSAGDWFCTQAIDKSVLPMQLEQLIVARLDRLEEETRALVHVAAVIGVRFAEVLLPRSARRQHLATLVDTGLIELDEGAFRTTYHFKHALIRDIAYESMLFARRRELHAQVALEIEWVYAGNLGDQRVVLAHHYQQAEQLDRAFPHFLLAGRQAQAHYANREALALYEQALASAPWRDRADDPPDLQALADLYENIGDVLALTSEYAGARAHYQRLLGLVERSASQERLIGQAALLRKIGSSYENQGELDQAIEWLARAAEIIAPAEPGARASLEHARVLSDTGWVFFRRGEAEIGQSYLERALAQLEPYDPYNEQARVLNRPGESAEIHNNIATAKKYDPHDEQARILNRLGGVAWTHGDVAAAKRYVEQSLIASERSANLANQASALNNLAILTQDQGLLADSTRYSLQALEINERVGSRRELAISSLNIGWAFYHSEDYEAAQTHFNNAIDYAKEVRDMYAQMRALRSLGYALIEMRQLDRAYEAIQQSQAIVLQLHLPVDQIEGYVALAELALRQGELSEALHQYQLAETMEVDPESEEFGRLQRIKAAISLAQGATAYAIELLKSNEALFMRLHNVPETQRTQKLLAAILRSTNTSAS